MEEPLEPAAALGNILRQLRQEAGLTQEELGFEAVLRRTYVSILALGQQQPSLATILKLASALDRSGAEFIGLVEAKLGSAQRRR